MPTFATSIQHISGSFSQGITQAEEIKNIQIGKEEAKLSVYR
jgi:hypothetical protein